MQSIRIVVVVLMVILIILGGFGVSIIDSPVLIGLFSIVVCILICGGFLYTKIANFKIYTHLGNLKILKEFILLLVLFYLLLIAVFGLIYYLIALNTLHCSNFFTWFYFSSVTLATVGYGDISPVNEVMQFFVIIESFIGYISLPIIVSIGLSLILKK